MPASESVDVAPSTCCKSAFQQHFRARLQSWVVRGPDENLAKRDTNKFPHCWLELRLPSTGSDMPQCRAVAPRFPACPFSIRGPPTLACPRTLPSQTHSTPTLTSHSLKSTLTKAEKVTLHPQPHTFSSSTQAHLRHHLPP